MKTQRHPLIFLCVAGLMLLLCRAVPARAHFTLLIPDQPTMEQKPRAETKRAEAKNADKETAAKPETAQMDVLIAFAEPAGPDGLDMDMPQMFAVIRHYEKPAEPRETREDRETDDKQGTREKTEAEGVQPHREDLLGELEEIRYLDKKAWAVNVPLHPAGLYQLITESRPWWDEQRDLFRQHFVKTIIPVYGQAEGWDQPAGLKFEILPLTRPFGTIAPALFTGKVLLSGEPLRNAYVRVARLDTDNAVALTSWQKAQIVKTDAEGRFSFVCPLPGWWGFMALAEGDPLKGVDGQPKKLEIGAVLWVYTDKARPAKAPRSRR